MKKGLTNIQIKQEIQMDAFSKNSFLGVFAKDSLPKISIYPSSLVLNTDTLDGPGEHWLAIYFDKNKNCTFFDSFGRRPESFGLEKYLQHYSWNVEYNTTRLQGLLSTTCGFYCIYFILLKSREFSLMDIISHFSSFNFELNDFKIKNITNK